MGLTVSSHFSKKVFHSKTQEFMEKTGFHICENKVQEF